MSGTLTSAMRMPLAISRARYLRSSIGVSALFRHERVVQERLVESGRDDAFGRVTIERRDVDALERREEDGKRNPARREHGHGERADDAGEQCDDGEEHQPRAEGDDADAGAASYRFAPRLLEHVHRLRERVLDGPVLEYEHGHREEGRQ